MAIEIQPERAEPAGRDPEIVGATTRGGGAPESPPG